MNDLEQRLTSCFMNTFPQLSPEQTSTASMTTLEGWDSVAQITLLAGIAEDFGIDLEMADFQELTSYTAILDYLQRRLASS